jgi:hypothetical protein
VINHVVFSKKIVEVCFNKILTVPKAPITCQLSYTQKPGPYSFKPCLNRLKQLKTKPEKKTMHDIKNFMDRK